MRKKIAFISDHASPLSTLGGVDSGGQNVYVAEVARSLATMGYFVDIYTRREQTEIAEVVDFAPGVRVIHITAGPPTPIPKEELFIYMTEFSEQMINFIDEEQLDYDLVHAHFWLSGMVAMDIKRQLNIPFVITFHALGAVRRIHQGEADKFPKQREQIEQEIIWHAEKIIAECPNDMKDLMELYYAPQEKLEIIPCGFNPSDFYPIPKDKAKETLGLVPHYQYVLQLGRIVPRKGIDNVIEAFAHIHQDMPLLRLLIVGGNAEEKPIDTEMERLQNLCREKGVEQQVMFTGNKEREILKYYYSASDIFITTPWYEPFGITPLEAMACGTPVIGSDVGGIAFTVRKNETGRLVPPKRPELLAKEMLSLLTNKNQLRAMSKQASEYVRNTFTWNTVSEQICELYEKIIPVCRDKKKLQHLKEYFHQASQTFIKAAEVLPQQIATVAEEMCQVLATDRKILICGNGGSAAESQHFVAELVGRFEIPKRAGYAVMSLNTDNAVLTAWANDFGYDHVFQRQVQSLGNSGDMLICLSTSGNSPNIIHALKEANDKSMVTVNLLGKDGGKAAQYADINIIVPSEDTGRIQEVHLHIIHQLCWLVENQMEEMVPAKQDKKISKLIA